MDPGATPSRKAVVMDNWDDLKFLVAVSKAGTMTGAAKLLGTNVATVSRRVDRLTQQLGMAPFVKTADGWQPSEAIAGLLEVASAFEGRLSSELNQAKVAEPRNRVPIRIGCPSSVSSFILFPALVEPEGRLTSVQLEFTDRVYQEGLGDNDIVIRVGPPEGGRLRTKKVGDMPVNLYGPADVSSDSDWVGLEKIYDEGGPGQLGLSYFGREPLMRVPTFRSLLDLIVQSHLPGPLPDVMAEGFPDLKRVPDGPTFVAPFWVIYHESRKGDPAIETTVDWIDHAFSRLQAQSSEPIPAK